MLVALDISRYRFPLSLARESDVAKLNSLTAPTAFPMSRIPFRKTCVNCRAVIFGSESSFTYLLINLDIVRNPRVGYAPVCLKNAYLQPWRGRGTLSIACMAGQQGTLTRSLLCPLCPPRATSWPSTPMSLLWMCSAASKPLRPGSPSP